MNKKQASCLFAAALIGTILGTYVADPPPPRGPPYAEPAPVETHQANPGEVQAIEDAIERARLEAEQEDYEWGHKGQGLR